MKRLIALSIILLMSAICSAATLYIDRDANKYPLSTDWTTGGLPAQPNAEWRFADGLDFDTLVTEFRNYGATNLATELTIGNSPALTEGILARDQSALTYDDVGTYLTILDPTVLDPGAESYTIFAVVRATAAGDILGKIKASGNGDGIILFVDVLGKPNLATYDAAGGSNLAVGTTTITGGSWYFLAGVYRYSAAANDTSEIWVNGVMQDDAIAAITTTTNAGNLLIGIENFGGFGSPLGGDIAWIGVWDGTALTGAQILALYNFMAPTGTSANPFPSLQSAIRQGTAGDTLLLADGRYQETVTVSKAFDYIGASSTAFGAWPEFYGAALPASAGNDGLIVSADNEIGYLAIRGYYTAGGIGIQGTATSDGSLFHHLELDSCLTGANFDGQCSADSLVNCTIDEASLGSSTGISWSTNPGGATTVYVINTIVVNATTGITEALANATFANTYCDFYGNGTAYGGSCAAGTGDISVLPRFKAQSSGDYRPYANALKSGTNVRGFAYIGAWSVLASNQIAVGGWGGRDPAKWGRFGVWGGR